MSHPSLYMISDICMQKLKPVQGRFTNRILDFVSLLKDGSIGHNHDWWLLGIRSRDLGQLPSAL